MKYYLIVGEASGDLHASHLMHYLKKYDSEAQFRFLGGDLMSAEGGTRMKHYRELAYMGFIPVITHLPTILGNMKRCKRDIAEWAPDVVILVDYPGFNLNIAKYVHSQHIAPVYYYISPKIWAWKEHRIKNIKRDVDELFSILPFEEQFFHQRHQYPIHYVGNPTADEVNEFLSNYNESDDQWRTRHGWTDDKRPMVALLAGSRRQEIKDNLPAMLTVAARHPQWHYVVAGAPSIEHAYYEDFLTGNEVDIVYDDTYALLTHSQAALVTSGTATLETALFGVPQAVCYRTPMAALMGWLKRRLLHVDYVSLVNLVAGREVVKELVADTFSVEAIDSELTKLMDDDGYRKQMMDGYSEVRQALGTSKAPDCAAQLMTSLLRKEKNEITTNEEKEN